MVKAFLIKEHLVYGVFSKVQVERKDTALLSRSVPLSIDDLARELPSYGGPAEKRMIQYSSESAFPK